MQTLSEIFDGWNEYRTSLVKAVAPLTREQLTWRPSPHLRSTGEMARHISLGRIIWFARMSAPGNEEIIKRIKDWEIDSDGNQDIVEDSILGTESAGELVEWLDITWQVISETLATWEISDLAQVYEHVWNGKKYLVSRQWTLWHVLSHDIHHGGQLSLMFGLQGIKAFELNDLYGHIVLPPLAD